MTTREIFKKYFFDKKEINELRLKGAKIMFILNSLIFFTIFYLFGAGFLNIYEKNILSPIYILFIISLNFYIFFLFQKIFFEKKLFSYIISIVFFIISIFFILPVIL